MNQILKAWNAGFVRRWHNHPFLVQTNDPDSGHQQRCTVLLLLFFPGSSRDAIIDCITHDQGEIDAGDMSHNLKLENPNVAAFLDLIETQSREDQGFEVDLKDEEIKRRKFVDLLDAYVWMLRHFPELRFDPKWIAQSNQLRQSAIDLSVSPEFEAFITAAREMYIK